MHWRSRIGRRSDNYQNSCQKNARTATGSCISVSLISATVFFMFVAFASNKAGTDIQAPLYTSQEAIKMAPEVEKKTVKMVPERKKPFCNMFDCPTGFSRLQGDPSKSECAGSICAVRECCEITQSKPNIKTPEPLLTRVPKTFCNMFECPTGLSRLAGDPAKSECAGSICAVRECCEITQSKPNIKTPELLLTKAPKAFCNMFECPTGLSRLAGDPAKSECAGSICAVGECCEFTQSKPDIKTPEPLLTRDPKAFCNMFECPTGLSRLAGDPAKSECAGSICAVRECCVITQSKPDIKTPKPLLTRDPKAFCNMFECPTGLSRLQGDPAKSECAKYPCAVGECCEMTQSNAGIKNAPKSLIASYQKAFCNMFECPTGLSRLEGNPAKTECTKYPCSVGECCAIIQ